MDIAVIGAGNWGKNHVKCLAKIALGNIGVYDPCSNIKNRIQTEFKNIKLLREIEDALKFDAVIIAAPTQLHQKIGSLFLANKVPCFIEKPLAFSEEESNQLLYLAQKTNTLLAVGHIEHFNPSFLKLKKIIKDEGSPQEIVMIREGMAKPGFDTSVDVIFDLMIHDIGIMLDIIGPTAEILHFDALNLPNQNDPLGSVKSLLKFRSGTVVSLSASRTSPKKTRELHLQYKQKKLVVNFLEQTVTTYYNNGDVVKSEKEPSNKDQLQLEIENFINAIKNRSPLAVPLSLAHEAVKIANLIKNKTHTNHKKASITTT